MSDITVTLEDIEGLKRMFDDANVPEEDRMVCNKEGIWCQYGEDEYRFYTWEEYNG